MRMSELARGVCQPFYYSVYGGQPARRTGAQHASISPYGPYAAAGGQVFLGLQNDREWAVLCERVLGLPDLVSDERFRTNPDRVAHDAELTRIIEAALAALTPDEVVALLDEAGIASARLRTPADFAAHPQLAARNRWREVGTPGGPVRALLPPVTCPAGRPRWARSRRSASTPPRCWPSSATNRARPALLRRYDRKVAPGRDDTARPAGQTGGSD